MVKVDMQTANLLTQVFKKVNPKMKKILSDLGYNNPAGLIKTLWAVVKQEIIVIKMSELIKQQNDMIRKESGMNVKEEKLNEVDFSKVKLPATVNRFLGKFVQSMKDANLNRIKRSAILYKVIEASGMSPQQLMADIGKIKRELK